MLVSLKGIEHEYLQDEIEQSHRTLGSSEIDSDADFGWQLHADSRDCHVVTRSIVGDASRLFRVRRFLRRFGVPESDLYLHFAETDDRDEVGTGAYSFLRWFRCLV